MPTAPAQAVKATEEPWRRNRQLARNSSRSL